VYAEFQYSSRDMGRELTIKANYRRKEGDVLSCDGRKIVPLGLKPKESAGLQAGAQLRGK
jgi:hypothetical protein